jgi:two-component system, OmpR family, sensor kinase
MNALHIKLTMVLAALLMSLALGLLLLMSRTSDRYADELRQRLDAGIAMYVVRELTLINGTEVNDRAWRELANRAMTVNPSAEVYLLDPTGAVISSIVPLDRLQRRTIRLEAVRAFLQSPDLRPIYGDDPTRSTGRRVFSVAPIKSNGVLSGYLYVVLGGQPERSIAADLRGSYALRAGAVALGLVLLTTLVAGGGLFAALTRRLRALDKSMDDWSKTVPMVADAPAANVDGDEISALKARFAAMSGAIEQQIGELQLTDELRRELIANVSHDLRTPLASLRGYIETLLIKDSNSSQELKSHLNVALRQADQLGRLVDALFELARLESGTVAPQLEPVSIAELLQDIAMRFRMTADKRGVALQTLLDLSGVMVIADVEQIERALGNLLENAIQHTPRGGQVRIEMATESDLVRVRVIDTGRGIAPEHLPHIFKRFYSVRDRADRGHTGLGLAIVKRIVELHSQSVSILSKPGTGTTVEFTLQRTSAPMITALVKSA